MSDDRLDVHGIARWLNGIRAEAEGWLPRFLDLDGPSLSEELERHPELQPGIVQLLLVVAREACERSPERAHELTEAMIRHAGWGRWGQAFDLRFGRSLLDETVSENHCT